jgi:CHAD domain-containing protein
MVLTNQILPPNTSEKARILLKRQLESLGDLRDTHVLQIFFRRHEVKFPGLAPLLSRLGRQERSLLNRASRSTARFKTKKAGRSVKNIATSLEHHSSSQPELSSIALRSANAAFANVIDRWRLIDPSDRRTIHRTRVAFKKFRYIVESLPPHLTGFSKGDLRNLARYQRAMGNIQDLEVISASLAQFIKRNPHIPLRPFCRYVRSRRTRAVRFFLERVDRLVQFWPPRGTAPNHRQSDQQGAVLGLPAVGHLVDGPSHRATLTAV